MPAGRVWELLSPFCLSVTFRPSMRLTRAPRWCAFAAQTILTDVRHSSRSTTPHTSASHATPPPRPRFALALSALVTRLFRGTFAPNPETFRVSGRGSAQNSAREIGDLASDFASLQFSKRPARNTKRREVAAHECFRLAGPTGLEPATSGVTGRRSRVRRDHSLYMLWNNTLITNDLPPLGPTL